MGEATPPDPSPYRPPAMLPEQEPDPLDQSDQPEAESLPLPLPLWVSAAFAATAIAIHLGVTLSGMAGRGTNSFVSQLYLLAALLTPFTLGCFGWYVSQSWRYRHSLQGNILLALWVPAIALLNFVPAFLAITLVVFTVGYSLYLMLIPLAVAYFVAAVAISRWMWWWFAGRC